ncbi:sensor histidine kinase [Haloarcula laminariae]|uniref:sensor histidine kinase n=1 Tax=Haloarcula laminariae TaxID=2961577 RepID=UPI0021C7591D|nr:ATP-binding protein [Halomicroarcula laminariae]
MFGVDGAGTIGFATESFASRLDTTPARLAGTRFGAVVAPDSDDPLADVETLRGRPAGETRRCRAFVRRGEEPVAATFEFAATEGRQVVGTVRERTEQYRHLFEQSHDAIVLFEIVDRCPVVRAVNAAFVTTFGYGRSDIVGESLNEFIVPDERWNEATDYDRRTAAGKTNHAVVSRKTVDGRREFVYRGLTYTTADDRRYGFAIYSDVTDDRRRRRRLQVLHRVLRHNIRNDLSVVIGTADYIERASGEANHREAAARILTAAERIASISEQARAVEVALSNRSDRAIDAAEVVRSVVETYDGIRTTAPTAAPVTGGVAVYSAVENLVENAVAHTPEGTAVRVTVADEGDEWRIRIADEGPGIPAIERGAVFDDEDITTLSHGTGLGLWLARWVAESAGGALRYDRDDGWTVVTLVLPRADDSDDVLSPHSVEFDPNATY